jgi:putative addiction module component (TIGR02574 family)
MIMARSLPNPPPGFDELPTEEKLDYVQSLWDRIAAKPEEVPMPAWHLRVLEERMAEYEADPQEGSPWEEVRDEILRELESRRSER